MVNIITIDGVPYERNLGPGKLYVLEGPDLVGKSTVGKYLQSILDCTFVRYDHWASIDAKSSMLDLMSRPEATEHPTLVQNLIDRVCLESAIGLKETLAKGTNIMLDRWLPSLFVYGMASGLPLDFLLQMGRYRILPDFVLVLMRDRPLKRDEHLNTYDRDISLQNQVRILYRNWLILWWKARIPQVPIGGVNTTGMSREEAAKRVERRMLQLIKDGD